MRHPSRTKTDLGLHAGQKLLRRCDGVSGQSLREDAWHQEGGHGHCQAHHLERIQHIGGHKRGPDLITNLQHPRSIHVHARTRHCQKLHVKSESQRKPERHSRKEKPDQDWPESVSENKLDTETWEMALQTSTNQVKRSCGTQCDRLQPFLKKRVSNASTCLCRDERWITKEDGASLFHDDVLVGDG